MAKDQAADKDNLVQVFLHKNNSSRINRAWYDVRERKMR